MTKHTTTVTLRQKNIILIRFIFSWNTLYQFHLGRYCKPMRSRTHFLKYLTVISLKLCKAWGWLGKWVETCRKKTNILWQLYNCIIYCCAWLYFSPILYGVEYKRVETVLWLGDWATCTANLTHTDGSPEYLKHLDITLYRMIKSLSAPDDYFLTPWSTALLEKLTSLCN
jgi:hypothetical protein